MSLKPLYTRRMICYYTALAVMMYKPEISQYVMALALSIVGVAGIEAVKSNPQNVDKVE